MTWSIVGSWVVLLPLVAPESAHAGKLAWGALSATLTSVPVTTDSQGLTASSGASSSLSVQASPTPVWLGTQRDVMIPFPKNQKPNRTGVIVPSAYAVPLPLSIAPRRGSGTTTLAPPARRPRRTVRREIPLRPKTAILFFLLPTSV